MDFIIRDLKESDLESLVKYANNWDISKNLSDRFPYPYTEKDGKEFLKFAIDNPTEFVQAIDIDGECIGTIGLHPQKDIYAKNVEIGYWIAEPFWGKGIATRAVKQIVEIGFERFDCSRIFARAFGTNKGSQRVLEKAGFQFEYNFEKTLYKDGQYFDDLVYGIRRP